MKTCFWNCLWLSRNQSRILRYKVNLSSHRHGWQVRGIPCEVPYGSTSETLPNLTKNRSCRESLRVPKLLIRDRKDTDDTVHDTLPIGVYTPTDRNVLNVRSEDLNGPYLFRLYDSTWPEKPQSLPTPPGRPYRGLIDVKVKSRVSSFQRRPTPDKTQTTRPITQNRRP